ncbi:MAG: hypothetical protein RI897_1119 [Verrucomicrobiota bacterium]|jgi:hypothetical protein
MNSLPIRPALLGVTTLLAFSACSPSSHDDHGQSAAPSPAPLTEATRIAATQHGREIAAEVGKSLSSVLLAAIQEGGPTNAIPLCSVQAAPLTASLAMKHGVTIRRVSHRPRNAANRASDSETQIIQQYQEQKAAAQPLQPLLQTAADGGLTFYAPIAIATNLCLNCHGIPGDTLAPETGDALAKLYPQDQATGFKLGDLRGLWRIDFPHAFVNNLSAQEPAKP